MYFVLRSNEKDKERVLSLGKLKTIEYWIYWKLREKLWNFWQIHYDNYFVQQRNYEYIENEYDKKYNGFLTEAKELFKGFAPPWKLQFYYDFAD